MKKSPWHSEYNILSKQILSRKKDIRASFKFGRVMAQVVSRWPLTAETRVRAQVNPCVIYGGQSGTGAGFSPSSSVFPCQYIIPPSLSKLVSSEECVIC
jgi:hypothetical protein